MGTARLIIGDVREVLRTLAPGSVDLVLSSPPFLALRSYLPTDHPSKHLEMGSESTPGAFIDALLDVTEECRRVLTPHGSLVFELGDTYAGSGDTGWHRSGNEAEERYRSLGAKSAGIAAKGNGWPLDKSLTLIPEIYRFALVYGFNPLTGRETPRWRARNVIRWCRPNPPVGALGDKVRPATSDMVVACVGRRRYFDLDSVRVPGPSMGRDGEKAGRKASGTNGVSGFARDCPTIVSNPAGAPPLDHWWYDDVFEQDAWLQSTEPYPGSHYATWPRDLLVKPILAMCPPRVCRVCGVASERVVGATEYVPSPSNGRPGSASRFEGNRVNAGVNQWTGGSGNQSVARHAATLGWTDCGHNDFRPGLVLDCFAGSGTTLAVATGNGRDAIGIDIDERNADLARERIGMFLEPVEHHDTRESA